MIEPAAPPGQPAATAPKAPLVALLLAWLIPGAGHIYLGKRVLGVCFAVLIFTAFAVGYALEGNLYRVVADRPLTILATAANMGLGVTYFIFRYFLGYVGNVIAAGYEYGSAFILTAGLMNLLLVVDVWDSFQKRGE